MKKFSFLFFIYLISSFAAFGADYYWVGGDGNWNDLNHWRTTSGGTVLPQVVPSSLDDVYFDGNSSTAWNLTYRVSINANATCRNITFTGSDKVPSIISNQDLSLSIYGNTTFQSGSIIRTNLYFQNTNTPKTIRTNGAEIGDIYTIPSIYMNESTSISLLDDFNGGARTSIYFQAGTFNTNNHKISALRFFANGTTNKTLNLGSSEIIVWGGDFRSGGIGGIGGLFNTNSSATTLNAGTSHIHFMGTVPSNYGIIGYSNQTFYDVTYEYEASTTSSMSGNLNFNQVEVKGGAYIKGTNTFNKLILAPGKTHTFPARETQTIKEKLKIGQSCDYTTVIKSNVLTTDLSVLAGAIVELDGLSVQNVIATGIPLTANNSSGVGTTTGWTFVDASPAQLYWVGGAGDWGDASHWSLTSGGAGGACTPGVGTDVFFDANSGFTSASNAISLNGGASCKNITFSGSAVPPILTGSNQSVLDIYGSSVWQSGMTFDSYSIIYRNTGTPKTIRSNGVATGKIYTSGVASTVTIEETSSISLLDDFVAGGELTISAGTFNSNNNKITVYDRWANSRGDVLNLGSSDIYFRTAEAYFSIMAGSPVLNAGTSHFHFTEAITLSRGIAVTGNNKTVSFYDVSFENADATSSRISGGASGVVLHFNKLTSVGGLRIEDGDITAEELNLGASKTYTFPAGHTVTVNKKMTIGESCGAWTTWNTTTGGTQSTLSMPTTAALSVARVFMQDIKGVGKSIFTAVDSEDNGNNSTNWNFTTSPPKDLYWVGGAGNWDDMNHWALTSGGAGGACIPSFTDNVFFDVGSGFTATSTTVDITGAVYCNNITVSGSATPPVITSPSNASNSLNIYGSSVWQSGMTMSVNVINYQNSNKAKTITSNGVFTARSAISDAGVYPTWVNLYETTSVSLTDDFQTTDLAVYAGTFNTNNHNVTLNSDFSAADNTNAKTLNLGSSVIQLIGNWSVFDVSSSTVTLNAGTSHIQFTGRLDRSEPISLKGYPGQVFNNVTMATDDSYSGYIITSPASAGTGLTFNIVTLMAGSVIEGNNVFNELRMYSSVRYSLEAGKTQTIKNNLAMGGTPCAMVEIASSGNAAGVKANIDVKDGRTSFNFVDLKSVNASGLSLHFGSKSVVANQNNSNVTFDPYESGELKGLAEDMLCHVFDNSDSTTYIISGAGFFGNEYTKYAWTKTGDPNHTGVIATTENLDVRPFGYGTYNLKVSYYNGASVSCEVSGSIQITNCAVSSVYINPSIRLRVKTK